MADIKPQVYKDPRPAELFQPFHDWIRTHRPGWIYELVRMVLTPIAIVLYRERAIGTANVPADGPFILAPNHFSQMDHFFAGVYIRRKIQFMAKSQLYGNAILDYIFRVGGVFPVRRGHHDEEAFKTAYAVLGRGGCVGMYCEGGRSRSGRLGRAEAGRRSPSARVGRPGGAGRDPRLAGRARWKRLRFPKVTIQYGEPITFPRADSPSREQQLEAAQSDLRPRQGRCTRCCRGRGPARGALFVAPLQLRPASAGRAPG